MLIPEEYLCRDCGWVVDTAEHELGCSANLSLSAKEGGMESKELKKVYEVVDALDKDITKPFIGMKVRIRETAPAFGGMLAYVAYIGGKGVSVYLDDEEIFDDTICLDYGEFEKV